MELTVVEKRTDIGKIHLSKMGRGVQVDKAWHSENKHTS